ncbi:MAG TPA: hypothetical protein VK907_12345, partial [Phnomibacter sp.]|nr:hypothetical protein [Phnomibacter sp.]
HPGEDELLRKAALYSDDILRLHCWLNIENGTPEVHELLPPAVDTLFNEQHEGPVANEHSGISEGKMNLLANDDEPEEAPTYSTDEVEAASAEDETRTPLPEKQVEMLHPMAAMDEPQAKDADAAEGPASASAGEGTIESTAPTAIEESINERPDENDIVDSPVPTAIEEREQEAEVEIGNEQAEKVQDEDVAPEGEEDAAPDEANEDGADDDRSTYQDAIHLPGLSRLMDTPIPANMGIAIEPYHTVDYFASQGIKAEQAAENKEPTKLDEQVKSFTEWLKSMKKLSYQPATNYVDPRVDSQAVKSLSDKDIVTEAMAEVWAKQGKYEQAAQVYAKLMLLHPEKTHYFAARLQDLNVK